jgi:hypothetical protein
MMKCCSRDYCIWDCHPCKFVLYFRFSLNWSPSWEEKRIKHLLCFLSPLFLFLQFQCLIFLTLFTFFCVNVRLKTSARSSQKQEITKEDLTEIIWIIVKIFHTSFEKNTKWYSLAKKCVSSFPPLFVEIQNQANLTMTLVMKHQ